MRITKNQSRSISQEAKRIYKEASTMPGARPKKALYNMAKQFIKSTLAWYSRGNKLKQLHRKRNIRILR